MVCQMSELFVNRFNYGVLYDTYSNDSLQIILLQCFNRAKQDFPGIIPFSDKELFQI